MIEKFKTNAEVIENGDKYLYGNHVRMPISIERGEGAYVFDKDGNKYLDFIGGIAVNGLGHCHPAIVKCLEERSKTILHCSNYFYNEPAVQTAKLIVENSCFDKVLFANSGAEANEGQIKLARKYAKDHGHPERFVVITMKNSFHGRTLATCTATGQYAVHRYFEPLPSGFRYAEFNNLQSVKDIMDVYSDHLEGTDYDLTKGLAAGPFGCPSRWQTPKDVRPEDRKGDDWERPIALFRCSYSFVSQSRADMPDAVGGVLWFGEDSPDTTVYVPIYCGVTSVPKAWSETKRHVFDRDSAWWAFNLVNNWATIRWDAIYPEIRAKKASYEDKFFADQKTIEDHAVELYKKDPQKAVEYLTAYTNKAMNEVNDGWWDFAFELIGKYCDGGVMQPDGSQKTPGYPTEWLKAVDFGGMTERDLKATNSK